MSLKTAFHLSPILALVLTASAVGQGSSSEQAHQRQQQIEQQSREIEQRLQHTNDEGRAQLERQKQQLDREKEQLTQQLSSQRQSQQASGSSGSQSQSAQSSQAKSKQAEAKKDELKVAADEAKKEVTDINKASKIIGMKVVNKQNEDLGKIKDLVVDIESGKIAYAVLSSGGSFGMGGTLVAVPMESLTPLQGADSFVIDAQKDRLSQASGFNDKDWPSIDAAQDSTVGLSPTGGPALAKDRE